jgi:hypothetical protein
MWSKALIELSEEYLNNDGVCVKNQDGDAGILNIDYQNKIYTITLLTEPTKDLDLTFHSPKELIKAGWVVD